MKHILVTGASGFLGKYLLAELAQTDVQVVAISRHPKRSDSPKLKWVQADISDEASLLRPELLEELKDIDVVIHAAALYDLTSGHEELYRHNVIGTSHIIHLVRQLPKIPHLAHISTIAVAGNASQNFDESTFDVGQTFPDAYASTKFAAEHMVRNAEDIPSRSVYRLGIVVGSSIDGSMERVDGLYELQKLIRSLKPLSPLLAKIKFLPLPYNEATRLYLIPVNTAAHLISKLILKVADRPGVHTFHVTGGGRGVSVRRAIQSIMSHYEIPANSFPLPKATLAPFVVRAFKIPQNTGEYMFTEWTFSSKNLEREMPGYRYPSFAHFSSKLMQYADEHFFGKDTKR